MNDSLVETRHVPASMWLSINIVVGSLMFVLPMFGLFRYGTGAGPSIIAELGFCAAVALRSTFPRVALALVTCSGLLWAVLSTEPGFTMLAIPIVAYTMARLGDRRTRQLTGALMVLGSIIGPLSWRYWIVFDAQVAVAAVICFLTVGASFAIGHATRVSVTSRSERQAADAERQRHQLIEQEQRMRMNTVAERNRIARELHDIVAHSLSVIVVQAEGAKAIAGKNPQLASQVLTTIAETSRTSLAEMRSMVRLLRGETDLGDDYVPAPRLSDIPTLVDKTGNAMLYVEGDLPVVSEAIGLTAYRVVQESLTNVLKHAGPQAKATVRITYWPSGIQLEISDNGRGAAASSDGLGNGLRGMRERLHLHGGELLAQPQVGGGFVVRARLPYGPATTTSPAATTHATTSHATMAPQPYPHSPQGGLVS